MSSTRTWRVKCLERMDARLRGHTESIHLGALLALPAVPYDASDKHATRVSSQSLVRYRTNDDSVPVAFGHRDVLVRGYVDEVVAAAPTDSPSQARMNTKYSTRCTTWRCWSRRPALWTRRRMGSSRGSAASSEDGKARGSSCGCSGCLRPSPLTRWPPCKMSRGASYDAVKHLLAGSRDGRQDSILIPHLPSVSVSTTSATGTT